MAELGLCSRREAEALIAAGGVNVDDAQVSQPGHKIEPGQTLTLSDTATEALATRFTAVLNKPVGYVSAQPEGEQIPAVRLLNAKRAARGETPPKPDASLAPLGRLDQDSRGLLLLSDDGVLAKAIIGPQHTLEKEYLVQVHGKLTAGKLTLLRNGLRLDERRLKPARVTDEGDGLLRFVLREGRKRQIRRMCALVDLDVVDLHRIRIGPLQLGDLEEGHWRQLTAHERTKLIAASVPPKPKPTGSTRAPKRSFTRGKKRSPPRSA